MTKLRFSREWKDKSKAGNREGYMVTLAKDDG